MANKLTNEKLKELIKEVLSEQVLNEKYNVLPTNVKGFTKQEFVDDLFPTSRRKKAYQALPKKDFTGLADNDGDKNDLTVQDYINADPNDKIIKYISKKGASKHKVAATQAKGVSPGPGPGPGPGQQSKYPKANTFTLGKDFKNAIDQAIADYAKNQTAQAKQAITDYINFIANPQGSIAKQVGVQAKLPKLKKAIGTLLNNPNPGTANRAIKAVNSLMDAINQGITIKNRELDPLGRAPRMAAAEFESTGTTLQSLGSQTDSSTIAAFTAIKGGTLEEKFTTIADFSDEVETNGIDAAKKRFTLSNEALVNMAFVLTYIGDLSRILSASEAGVEFEKVLALLMGAAKVGAAGGGLDVVQQIGKNNFIYYSSKFQRSGTITQSYSSANGLHNQLEVEKKPVYYILAKKAKGGATSYQEIKLFLFKMEPINNPLGKTAKKKAGDVKVIDAKQNEKKPTSTDKHWSTYKDGNETYFKFNSAKIQAIDAFATLRVPISKGVNKTIESTANYMAGEISKSKDKMLKNISSVYQRLQNLELNTREYMGVQAGGKGTTTPGAYIAQLQKDYTGVKTDYNKALGSGTILENKKNKTKSIKDLDKLIERVIIESMNKK